MEKRNTHRRLVMKAVGKRSIERPRENEMGGLN
jgi:hypothetical protein